jgi:hypothetical protein
VLLRGAKRGAVEGGIRGSSAEWRTSRISRKQSILRSAFLYPQTTTSSPSHHSKKQEKGKGIPRPTHIPHTGLQQGQDHPLIPHPTLRLSILSLRRLRLAVLSLRRLTVLLLRRLGLSVLLLRRLAVLALRRTPVLLRLSILPLLRLPVLSLLGLAITSRSRSSRLIPSLLVHPLRRLSVPLLRLAVSLRRRRSAVPDVHVRISFIGERCQWVFIQVGLRWVVVRLWLGVVVVVVRANSR